MVTNAQGSVQIAHEQGTKVCGVVIYALNETSLESSQEVIELREGDAIVDSEVDWVLKDGGPLIISRVIL